jgi:DNA invertase Pin-like site-specific DNA recombinase
VRAVGYIRVSTEEQGQSGLGLEAQDSAIRAEVTRRGWDLLEVFSDPGVSGKDLRRPALNAALDRLKQREADVLVAAKLDRLTRSVGDFARLVERSWRERWSLVLLDLAVDTSTPTGEAMANVLAAFSQLERRLIGQRTREGLQVKKARGERLGPPPEIDPLIEERVVKLRRAGASLQEIVEALERDGVPTARGGRWGTATLRRLLARHPDLPTYSRGRRPNSPGTRSNTAALLESRS